MSVNGTFSTSVFEMGNAVCADDSEYGRICAPTRHDLAFLIRSMANESNPAGLKQTHDNLVRANAAGKSLCVVRNAAAASAAAILVYTTGGTIPYASWFSGLAGPLSGLSAVEVASILGIGSESAAVASMSDTMKSAQNGLMSERG